MLMLLLVPS